jgi:hypothetical protein
MQLSFIITSTTPMDLLATPYSTSLPSMQLWRAPNPTSVPAPIPSSYLRNGSNAIEGYISFTPTASDVGHPFTLTLTASNMSYLSVALRVAVGEGEPNNAQVADPPSPTVPTTHTLVLLNGQPQTDVVPKLQVLYSCTPLCAPGTVLLYEQRQLIKHLALFSSFWTYTATGAPVCLLRAYVYHIPYTIYHIPYAVLNPSFNTILLY